MVGCQRLLSQNIIFSAVYLENIWLLLAYFFRHFFILSFLWNSFMVNHFTQRWLKKLLWVWFFFSNNQRILIARTLKLCSLQFLPALLLTHSAVHRGESESDMWCLNDEQATCELYSIIFYYLICSHSTCKLWFTMCCSILTHMAWARAWLKTKESWTKNPTKSSKRRFSCHLNSNKWVLNVVHEGLGISSELNGSFVFCFPYLQHMTQTLLLTALFPTKYFLFCSCTFLFPDGHHQLLLLIWLKTFSLL